MNKTTLENLEYNKIKQLLEGYAVSSQGKEMVRRLEPAIDLTTIKHWLNETTEAIAIIHRSSSVPLHHLEGIELILQKVEKGMNLQPSELTKLLGLIKDGSKLKVFMKDKEMIAPLVSSYANSIYDLSDLEEKINGAIRFDQVDDSATPRLAKVRRKIGMVEEKIKSKLDGILRSSAYSDYIQENVVSVRDGRYVIPVKNSYRKNVEGNVLDKSSSGSTVFVEPKAVGKLQEELSTLKHDEDEEVYQILTYLSGLVAANKQELSINIETMAHYDFLFAKAKLSKSMDAAPVKLNKDKFIHLKGARHPLLGKDAVPLDIELGERYQTLVITGPNTGGKTVALKTVGLLTLMAQSGLHLPVDADSNVAIFHDVLVDIGDGQSIEQSLSTFSSHVRNLNSIMEFADDSTLVILDELGAGTDPGEGMGLATSILEYIHQKKSITMASTHYSEIKELASRNVGFENGSMEFDIQTLKPTYKLNIGKSGESNAFLIALRLGMNTKIIERAHEVTYKETKEYKLANEEVIKTLENKEVNETHKRQIEKVKVKQEIKKKEERRKNKSNYKIGDSVYISSLGTTGIVCELENNKGEIGVLVKNNKIKINKKRLSLFIDGKELYPEDYDMEIVLDTKENRKKRNTMKRKYVKDLKIETKGDE